MDGYPDGIFIGSRKAGSTWLWHCFQHHPQVFVHTNTDNTHYYSSLYHLRGRSWYRDLFAAAQPGQVVVEMCNDYLVDPQAPERIFNDNPNVKLIACLREPIARAVSQHWHGKKAGREYFALDEVFHSYVAYSTLLTPGFYADHLERFFQYFPRERVLVVLYDELEADPDGFLRKIYAFLGVEATLPPILHQRINQAAPRRILVRRAEARAQRLLDRFGLRELARSARKRIASGNRGRRPPAGRHFGLTIAPELREQLLRVTVPEVAKLEKLLGIDLAHWKQ